MTARAWYVGLDLGARRFAASAAVLGHDGGVATLGCETAPPAGLERGNVVDRAAVRRSIGALMARVAEHLEAEVTAVGLTVPGSQCRRVAASAERRTEGPAGIPARQVEELRLRSLRVPAGAGAVLASSTRVRVDGRRWSSESRVVWGRHLRVDTEAWVVPSAHVEDYDRILSQLGLSIDLLMPRATAAGAFAMHPAEARRGALIIDVGDVESDVAVYVDGAPRALFTVPLGLGRHPQGSGHGYRDAGRQMRRDGAGRRATAMNTLNAESPAAVDLCHRTEIESLALFRQVRRRLEELDLIRAMGGGAVLVGENAERAGVADVAARVLELPVRGGRALGPEGGPGSSSPALAAVIGLVLTQARAHAGDPPAARAAGARTDPAQAALEPKPSTLGRWLREFVPVGDGR